MHLICFVFSNQHDTLKCSVDFLVELELQLEVFPEKNKFMIEMDTTASAVRITLPISDVVNEFSSLSFLRGVWPVRLLQWLFAGCTDVLVRIPSSSSRSGARLER